jgi:hypothetical protein
VGQTGGVRDYLARALPELSEIDGRYLPALLEKGGYMELGVRFGPPFVAKPFFLFGAARFLFGAARHGNTQMFPRAYFIQQS